MKKFFIIFIILLSVSLIYSNMRAPYYRDGSLSSNINFAENYKNIILIKETMDISVNKAEKNFTEFDSLKMDIKYYIENKSNKIITVPVDFLGIGVKNYTIKNNGENLKTATGKDFESQKMLLKLMYKHRKNWNTEYYGIPKIEYEEEFIDAFSSEKKLDKFSYDFFDRHEVDFQVISSELKLKPGINIININYNQITFINEIHPVYRGFNYSRALIGFDYLLYPALSWNFSNDFIFKIKITIPDIKKHHTYCRSNLILLRYYNKKEKTAVFKGEYKDFPADIFTFLLDWKRK